MVNMREDERLGEAMLCWRLLEELGIDQLTLQNDFLSGHLETRVGPIYLCEPS